MDHRTAWAAELQKIRGSKSSGAQSADAWLSEFVTVRKNKTPAPSPFSRPAPSKLLALKRKTKTQRLLPLKRKVKSVRGSGARSSGQGLRGDAPVVRSRGIGSLPKWNGRKERADALADLMSNVEARTTNKTTWYQWRTSQKALAEWNLTPWPITTEKVIHLAASLKRGGFRSARNYRSLYRVQAERRGQEVTSQLLRTLRDVGRSCARGMGAPSRSISLPLDRLGELPDEDEPWTKGGPVGPKCATIAGSMFLMREVELSCSRASSVTVEARPDRWQVRWLLPASKTDP